jgi:flagellar assembly factor FliW
MQSIQENIIVDLILQNTKKIHLIEGMGGFGEINDFILSINPTEAPLVWLVAQSNPDVSFLTLDPFLVCPDYQPEFSDEDLDLLNIQNVEEMLVLCMAHLGKKHSHQLSVNLKAPIVINWATGLGKQLIITNQQEYLLEHKLNVRNGLKAA